MSTNFRSQTTYASRLGLYDSGREQSMSFLPFEVKRVQPSVCKHTHTQSEREIGKLSRVVVNSN